jgi:hypothetical protein
MLVWRVHCKTSNYCIALRFRATTILKDGIGAQWTFFDVKLVDI